MGDTEPAPGNQEAAGGDWLQEWISSNQLVRVTLRKDDPKDRTDAPGYLMGVNAFGISLARGARSRSPVFFPWGVVRSIVPSGAPQGE